MRRLDLEASASQRSSQEHIERLHLIGRAFEVQVFWGYALFPDRVGNFLPKAMAECNKYHVF
jgi:myosin-crossreactive antigen